MARKSNKLEAIHTMFDEYGINASSIEHNENVIFELKRKAKTIHDVRHESYVRHLLVDIVMITVFAVLGNANEWSEIESFAKKKETWLRKYLELPNGIPTDDTIRIVIGSINTAHFYNIVVQFLIEIMNGILKLSEKNEDEFEKEIVAVDGKTTTGSKREATNVEAVKALHTLNAFSTSYGMCIGQVFVNEKSNEIPAAPELIAQLDIRDCVVTWDALNTQKTTVDAIIQGKGDYVAALKGNHPIFYQEVQDYFMDDILKELTMDKKRYKKTIELEHSALVIREYFITEDILWYTDRKDWKGLKTIGMVRKTTKKKTGEILLECRYYINSIETDIELFARAVREHWGVENCLLWQLDFTFKDDKNTSMAKTSAKNLQIVKKIVLSILNIVKSAYKISLKRIRYELSLDYEKGTEQLFSMLSINAIENAINK